ncbi:MAG: helix repeat-containing protein, partial [Pedosphaera sp.]|nr:helix repeat-containing protein [Pedosphaera sp.]
VAAAVAAAAKQILLATLGGFSYARAVANTVSAAVWVIGVFAALNQLGIAPAIVNGLFYAMLVIIVGSAVISIGVGGIAPMRALLERALGRVQAEAPNIKAAAATASERTREPGQTWQPMAAQQPQPEEHERELPETPRFPTQP